MNHDLKKLAHDIREAHQTAKAIRLPALTFKQLDLLIALLTDLHLVN